MIITQLLWAFVILLVTLAVQAWVIDRTFVHLNGMGRTFSRLIGAGWRVFLGTFVMIWLAVPHMLAIAVWALFYMYVAGGEEAIPFETALYFSGSAYTTVGFGDITMSADWRVISTAEALNGLFLLAGSAAALVEIMTRLYRNAHAAAPARKTGTAAKQNKKEDTTK